MGLLRDFLGGTAFAIGEVGRMARTEKEEKRNMTPELQRAIDNLIKRAEAGDIEAMTDLADAYYKGIQTRGRGSVRDFCNSGTVLLCSIFVCGDYLLYGSDINYQKRLPVLAGKVVSVLVCHPV